MHKSIFESCRIHHNSDYSGDIIITNTQSTSKKFGKLCNVASTTKHLVSLFKIHNKAIDLNLSRKSETVIIEGNQKEGF